MIQTAMSGQRQNLMRRAKAVGEKAEEAEEARPTQREGRKVKGVKVKREGSRK